jgi:hypothetical protein
MMTCFFSSIQLFVKGYDFIVGCGSEVSSNFAKKEEGRRGG